MPKTNPPHRSNNYGLYGVLVLLLTVAYHHYFGSQEVKVEAKSIAKTQVEKIQQVEVTKPLEKKLPEASIVNPLKTQPIEDEEEKDFANERERQNCMDYIGRHLDSSSISFEMANENLEKKLLKKYPGWYIGVSGGNFGLNPKTFTSGAGFAAALNHLKFANNTRKDDPAISQAQGLLMLTNMYESTPENSAILIYLAIAHDKMGNEREVRRLLNNLEKTEYFNAYTQFVMSDVYRNVESVNELMASIIYKYRLVRPDYSLLMEFSRKYDISRIGYQIMERNLPESKDFNPFSWDQDEHIVGLAILEERQPELAKKYKNSTEYIKTISSKFPFDEKRISVALAKECELKTLENQLKLIHKFAEKYPIRNEVRMIRGVAGK